MKIILSRKGFDSASGGSPSPILPDGSLLSLPIPEDAGFADGAVAYRDLRVDADYSYADVMQELAIRVPDGGAHCDPDLQPAARPRRPAWRPLFGQAAAAQGHLRNQRVGAGDLFLFFGLFRHTERVAQTLRWRGEPARHVIWGYLQVQERWDGAQCHEAPEWATDHPHIAAAGRHQNAVYVARRRLSFADDVPGAGRLRYHAGLELTAPGSRTASLWRLPDSFWPADGPPTLTYHTRADRWARLSDAIVHVRSVGRGQEFVVGGTPAIMAWVRRLIEAGLG